MDRAVTPEKFSKILLSICNQDTSQTPDRWTSKNPLLGHCAVVSLVAQNLFGGELMRGSLEHTKFAEFRSHYWNRLPGGTEIDFTKMQFGKKYPVFSEKQTRGRAYVLSHSETVSRYKILNFRFLQYVYGANKVGVQNSLFHDRVYQACFSNALDSPCQKMKFGCAILYNSHLIYIGHNATIKPLKSLCEPTCVRFSIQSRTESMIGACGHAEELGLWNVIHHWKGIPISECELYIAGFYPNSMPYLKSVAEHTCLRCAVQMYHAKIKKIYVPVREVKMNHSDVEMMERFIWKGITPEEAVRTARAYAMKERSI